MKQMKLTRAKTLGVFNNARSMPGLGAPCQWHSASREWRHHSLPEPDHRDQVKRLTRLFYHVQDGATAQQSRPTPSQLGADSNIDQLPLWRIEWPVFPCQQEILYVLAPHYVHMFEGIFSRPRPWLFGHLYLPGGSNNLGNARYRLASGSQTPLIGVLMQVTRAVRLRDGKFLLLATAIKRFKVVKCLQELPYSMADVQVLEDCELQDTYQQPALAAVMQAAGADTSISALMAASTAVARDACEAVSWAWLRGYELSVASQQEWPGPGPREGESDMETHHLVQELTVHGVSKVLPLPDGVVIGRRDLTDVVEAANQALQKALAAAPDVLQQQVNALNELQQQQNPASGQKAASLDGFSPRITGLNTTQDRGVQGVDLPGENGQSSSLEDVLMLEAAVWTQLDTLVALASRVKGRRQLLPFGLLQLRPAPVSLKSIFGGGGSSSMSPEPGQSGLALQADDQLGRRAGNSGSDNSSTIRNMHRNSPSPVSAADDASSSSSSSNTSSEAVLSSSSSSRQHQDSSLQAADRSSSSGLVDQSTILASKYAYAASDGMDIHADPLWPPLRRAAKLSWAATVVVTSMGQGMEQGTANKLQALLETASIAQRLRFVLQELDKHAKVLAALAAVKEADS